MFIDPISSDLVSFCLLQISIQDKNLVPQRPR